MANLKSIKKGDKVILRMFTGAFVEAKEVEMADKTRIGFTNKKGIKMVFDKATGKQITPEPKAEKFANYLENYDPEVEAAEIAKKANKKRTEKSSKKTAVKKAKEVEEDFEDTEEDI